MAQSFGPFWRFGSKCNPLGFRSAIDRQFLAAPDGGRSKPLEAHAGMVLTAVDQTPDITIEELRALLAEHDVTASHGAVWNLLARHGFDGEEKDGPCERAGT